MKIKEEYLLHESSNDVEGSKTSPKMMMKTSVIDEYECQNMEISDETENVLLIWEKQYTLENIDFF